MKRIVLLSLLLAFSTGLACDFSPRPLPPIEVRFSPKGGCTEAVVKEIGAAQQGILVQAYSFTSAPIAKTLVEAHRRGVKVQVILDESQKSEKYSSADFLLHAGMEVLIDSRHAIAHNKVMIVDGQAVITGSFNFTRSAEESNAENLLIIRDQVLAEEYTANWRAHAAHAEPYTGRPEAKAAPPIGADSPAAAAGSLRSARYFSSTNSQVFHRRECKAVGKISPQNLVGYAAREEAIRAGKRPCQECSP